MTEETKKRLPGIIDRIDELRDEMDRIHDAEVKETRAMHGEMDRVAQLDANNRAKGLYTIYAMLDDAARLLENF